MRYSPKSFLRKIERKSRENQYRSSRRQIIKNYLELHPTRKLQLGCGPHIFEGWLNTDIKPTKDEVIFLDVTEEFPFDDCTFDYIFSEHLIEHIEYQAGVDMLGECSRILRSGGRLRIATPSLSFLIELYNPKKSKLQEQYISWVVDTFLPNIGIYQDVFVINNFFRGFGHKFIYDFKSLKGAMNKVGFINIERYNVGESDDENLQNLESHGHAQHITQEFNKLETFVVEGRKPVAEIEKR